MLVYLLYGEGLLLAPRSNWRYAIAVIKNWRTNVDNKITKAKFDHIKTGFFAILRGTKVLTASTVAVMSYGHKEISHLFLTQTVNLNIYPK